VEADWRTPVERVGKAVPNEAVSGLESTVG
jgi:hypothetical protein